MASETCFECQGAVEEDQGRWLILDGAEDEALMAQLDKEYPLK